MMSASEQCFFCLTIVILGTSHLQNSKPLHYSAPSSWQCGGLAGTIAEGGARVVKVSMPDLGFYKT